MSQGLTVYSSDSDFYLNETTMLSKGCKPYKFESNSSLKLSVTNIVGLNSNFVGYESFFESNSTDILALCDKNLDESIDTSNFLVKG